MSWGGEWGQAAHLVVDDEPSIRRFLKHILEAEGFLVIESRCGEDAVAIARRETPSLVLLDLVRLRLTLGATTPLGETGVLTLPETLTVSFLSLAFAFLTPHDPFREAPQ